MEFLHSEESLKISLSDDEFKQLASSSCYFRALSTYKQHPRFKTKDDTIFNLPAFFNEVISRQMLDIILSIKDSNDAAMALYTLVMEKHLSIPRFIEFLNYMALDNIFVSLVCDLPMLIPEKIHPFMGYILEIYGSQSAIGSHILDTLCDISGKDHETVLNIVKKKRQFSINAIRILIRDGINLQSFLSNKRETECALCHKSITYIFKDEYNLRLGSRLPCCGKIIHRDCFWEYLDFEVSYWRACPHCFTPVCKDGTIDKETVDLHSALMVNRIRTTIRVPLNVQLPVPL